MPYSLAASRLSANQSSAPASDFWRCDRYTALDRLVSHSRTHKFNAHFSPASTGSPACRVVGCGREQLFIPFCCSDAAVYSSSSSSASSIAASSTPSAFPPPAPSSSQLWNRTTRPALAASAVLRFNRQQCNYKLCHCPTSYLGSTISEPPCIPLSGNSVAPPCCAVRRYANIVSILLPPSAVVRCPRTVDLSYASKWALYFCPTA